MPINRNMDDNYLENDSVKCESKKNVKNKF